jgi:transcriptional regulator with XRE-family HTH domain
MCWMTGVPETIALRVPLAEQIRRARKRRDLSQEELAWRSGVPPPKWFGRRPETLFRALLLSRAGGQKEYGRTR